MVWFVVAGDAEEPARTTFPLGNPRESRLKWREKKYIKKIICKTVWNLACFLLWLVLHCVTLLHVTMTHKLWNKLTRSQNGNRNVKKNVGKNLVVSHWNMESTGPGKKEELEAVLLEINQDIMIISEANMLMNLTDFEKQVIGYKMLLPLTVRNQVVARLVLLVREEFTIEKEPGVLKEIKYNKNYQDLRSKHPTQWTMDIPPGIRTQGPPTTSKKIVRNAQTPRTKNST